MYSITISTKSEYASRLTCSNLDVKVMDQGFRIQAWLKFKTCLSSPVFLLLLSLNKAWFVSPVGINMFKVQSKSKQKDSSAKSFFVSLMLTLNILYNSMISLLIFQLNTSNLLFLSCIRNFNQIIETAVPTCSVGKLV